MVLLMVLQVRINIIHQSFKPDRSKNNYVQTDTAGNRDGAYADDHENSQYNGALNSG